MAMLKFTCTSFLKLKEAIKDYHGDSDKLKTKNRSLNYFSKSKSSNFHASVKFQKYVNFFFENFVQCVSIIFTSPPTLPSLLPSLPKELCILFFFFPLSLCSSNTPPLEYGQFPGGHTLRERWSFFSQQLIIANCFSASHGTLCPTLLSVLGYLSGLSLSRPCACCNNPYKFICAAAVLCLKDTVYLWS